MFSLEQEYIGSVIYVDDEQNNLNSFRASFRREFRVHTAINAVEALKVLRKNEEIKVIISDQRMPDVSGIEFFDKIRSLYPNKVRIIITGYSDISTAIDSINKGEVYRYINKPWKTEDIRLVIIDAIKLYDHRMEIARKNQSLQTAYNELDKFVYSVSHDLRSPLMSILGITNLAELDVEDPKSLEYFASIKGMVEKLDGFIHQIINHYKDDKGGEFTDPVDFESLINEIVESIKYHPLAQGVSFNVNVKQNDAFISNRMNIKTILNNLISNAFKYQRSDEVNKKVDVTALISGEEAKITVSDNGVGIKEDKIEEVFSMFYRETQDDTGTGLGLFIVKEAIEKLDGKIELKSTFGEGTDITLNIPGKGE